MSSEQKRDRIPVPDDDGHAAFEVWKDGVHFRDFAFLDDAIALYMKGKSQGVKFEVRSKDRIILPKKSF